MQAREESSRAGYRDLGEKIMSEDEKWLEAITVVSEQKDRIAAQAKEIERLKKAESDLRKIHEEQCAAVKKAQMGFQYFDTELKLVSLKGG